MKYVLLLMLSVLYSGAFAQEGKKVQFIGGARSLISHSNFTSEQEDTITAPKSTGGYALIDLGVKINPNANTEILGMFRINNAFGGFWGGGVTFGVRQVHLKGVAGNFLRYQIGNIDYKLTPYTFYSHNADLLVSTFATTKIKEDVLNYESFFGDNTWRRQGASVNFALEFPKVIDEIEFNGFITRMNPTNLDNILERLQGGGNVLFKRNKLFNIGANHISIFDIKGTAANEDAYRNNVSSLTYDLWLNKPKYKLGVDGESGISSSYIVTAEENKLSDYFLHGRAYFELKKKDLSFEIAYMDNGPDFRSYGAQSKRVDFNSQNNFYQRYTNDQVVRGISAYDLYNDPALYSNQIVTSIMAYNPAVNNALPYGIATFNRRGAYVGVNYADSSKIIETDVRYYYLHEIRGQGTTALRNFGYLNGNVRFNLSNWTKWKKKETMQIGLAYQQTTRNSEFDFEDINLSSLTMNAGVELEVVSKLFVLGNMFVMNTTGNELVPLRNGDGVIINFDNYDISGKEINLSGGLKFNFSEDIYLAGIYESNKNTFIADKNYQYNQFLIYYVMKF
ncbi:MAG: hypothetical protein P8I55_11830 [Crocinitomix sp.]|nr:hypothetical protein [Crocinitomix sp.]